MPAAPLYRLRPPLASDSASPIVAPGRTAPGERVAVLYPPENPAAAIIDDGGGGAKTLLPTMAGLLVAVFGAYVAWAGRRSQLTFTEEP